MSKTLYISLKIKYIKMRIRSKRSFNGVLFGFIIVQITLLVLGIVTGKIVFYILMGIIFLLSILGVVALFTFLKKTGQESSSTRRSTYDISEGDSYVDESSTPSKKSQQIGFCDFCGMKLKTGVKLCNNCGKTSK